MFNIDKEIDLKLKKLEDKASKLESEIEGIKAIIKNKMLESNETEAVGVHHSVSRIDETPTRTVNWKALETLKPVWIDELIQGFVKLGSKSAHFRFNKK